jgi:hypothetical protein
MDYFVSEDAINDYKELILQGEHKSKKDICKDINKMCILSKVIEEKNKCIVMQYNEYLFMVKDNVIEYMYKQG